MKNKHTAREFSFQFLYHLELPVFEQLRTSLKTGANSNELANQLTLFRETSPVVVADEEWTFIKRLVSFAITNHSEIEQVIEKYSKNWKLHRMAKVNKALLVLGLAEIKSDLKTPQAVVINECVELAKQYGAEDSGSFINGILDAAIKNELP